MGISRCLRGFLRCFYREFTKGNNDDFVINPPMGRQKSKLKLPFRQKKEIRLENPEQKKRVLSSYEMPCLEWEQFFELVGVEQDPISRDISQGCKVEILHVVEGVEELSSFSSWLIG